MSLQEHAWRQVLDRIEADLDRAEEDLGAGKTPIPAPWSPPAGLGPPPEVLRPRAQRLLDRLRMVQAATVRARERLRTEESDVDRRRAAADAYRAAGRIA